MRKLLNFWRRLDNGQRINLLVVITSVPATIYKLHDETKNRAVSRGPVGFTNDR